MVGHEENEAGRTMATLDLRGVICPYNFVKTKLQLEGMKEGEMLEVLLDEGEPIKNVPVSIQNEGHTIVKQKKVGKVYHVTIKKSG